jgi:hypothetical protein
MRETLRLWTLIIVACSVLFPSRAQRSLRASPPQDQTSQSLGYKQVTCVPQTPMDAVVITKVTVAGQEVQCGLTLGPDYAQTVTPFQAGDDWLSQMDIYLFNRTNKTIAYATLLLAFPDTGNGITDPMSVYGLSVGRLPDVDAFSSPTRSRRVKPGSKPANFAPGQTLVIHVRDHLDAIKAYVEQRMPLYLASKLETTRGSFYFDDGMRWTGGGGFSVPDPEHQGKFKYLDPARFFPGRSDLNWPPPRRP